MRIKFKTIWTGVRWDKRHGRWQVCATPTAEYAWKDDRVPGSAACSIIGEDAK